MAKNKIHEKRSAGAETDKAGADIFLLAADIELSGAEMKILLSAITDKMFYLLDELSADGPVSNETMTTVNAVRGFVSCGMRTMTNIHDQSVKVMRAAPMVAA